MSNQTKNAVADAPGQTIQSLSKAPAPDWKDPFTIATASMAGLAALLMLLSPDLGMPAAVAGVLAGTVSAALAIARPAQR